jgi:single-strand DNA-binding protein
MNGAAITVVGNIARLELKFSNAGNAWVSGAIAVNEFGQKNGERTEHTTFFNFKLFGEFAENVAESIEKGNRVIVSGRLREEKWTDSSGQERNTMTLYVDEIGPSLRWARASVTRTGSGQNRQPIGAGAPVGNSSVDVGVDDNPFL